MSTLLEVTQKATKLVFAVTAFMLLAGVITSLATIIVICTAWLFAVAVVVGKLHIGPRASWVDADARAEFRTRSLELRIASLVLAIYAATVFVFVISVKARLLTIDGEMTTPALVVLGVLTVAVMSCGYLAITAPSDVRRMSDKLKRRLDAPVLF